ncbi:MAG: AbfB domain-containing protein [Bacillota bacterium]|nr:AbfB domain-containing protein [Bacillota bacterium]
MRYHGMVINITKDKAIVTTNDFQCFYIKRGPTIYIGKQVEFTEKDIIRKRSVYTKLGFAAACIVVLFAAMAFIFNLTNLNNIKDIYSSSKVFAYVDIDINPSMEIEIDDMGNVLKLVPLNNDAKVLIKKLNLNDLDISQTMNAIVDELKKSKILSGTEKDSILVSSTLNNEKSESDKEYQKEKKKLDILINSLKDNIQDKENGKVNVYLIQTNLYERKGAQSEGISTGRYVLYNSYRNLKSGFSIEDAKRIRVNDLLKDLLPNKSENSYTIAEDIQKQLDETIDSVRTPATTPSPLKAEDTMKNGLATPTGKQGNSNNIGGNGKSSNLSSQVPSNSYLPKNTPTGGGKLNTPSASTAPTDKNIDSQFVKLESYNYHGSFIQHRGFRGRISDETLFTDDALFKLVPGLADPSCISFESKNYPGYYLMHDNFKIYLKKYDGSANFRECATFKMVSGLADKDSVSFESFNYPNRYIRHVEFYLQIDEIKNELEMKDATYSIIKQK